MNSSLNFESFFSRVKSLFASGQFVDAWEDLVQYGSLYEDHRGEVDYLRMCVTARMGKPEISAHILDGALSAGSWYSDDLLLESSELEALRQQPNFEALLTRSRRLMDEESSLLSDLIIKEPQVGSDYLPLFMAMHDDDSSAKKQHKIWLDLGEHGYLMTFPQATHGVMHGIYRWGSVDEAEEVFKDHLERINRAYWVDMDRVLLGGMGRGGHLAATVALAKVMPARGFIAVKPILTPEIITNWVELVGKPGGGVVRGVFIEGHTDDARSALLSQFVENAVAAGAACQIVTIPETGRSFKTAVSRALPAAASFIMNS